jgi:hypothetical protein
MVEHGILIQPDGERLEFFIVGALPTGDDQITAIIGPSRSNVDLGP